MTFVELTLLLLYICVLVIKSCDPQTVQASAEVTTSALQAAMRAACRGFGFGETASGAPHTARCRVLRVTLMCFCGARVRRCSRVLCVLWGVVRCAAAYTARAQILVSRLRNAIRD